MVDAYIEGTIDRISPEAPVPVVRVKSRDHRLGGAANVALNIKALGAIPILCTVIGGDAAGKEFINRLKFHGIDRKGVIESETRPTTIKNRVMSGHHHVVRVDEESDLPLSKQDSNSLSISINQLLPTCDVIIIEDYDKGVLNPETIALVLDLASRFNIPVVVDPKRANFFEYKAVDLFKPNLKELQEGLNVTVDVHNNLEITSAIETLKKKLMCKGVMVTLSSEGVYLDYKGEKHRIAAHYRDVADVSGAGDTVISVASLALAAGLSPKTIAELANLAGGLVCEYHGVVPLDKELFRKELSKLNY